jgi:hypothetical protein
MASDYKFILDNGYIFYVCAESRNDAIKIFCEEHGMSKEFLEKHCVVKNMGRIKNASY